MPVDELCMNPLWRAEDLGKAIPDSPHAVSVALPLWEHVVAYEENDPAVVDALQAGYPRFYFHPRVTALFKLCDDRFSGTGEFCLAFPSSGSAARCVEYVQRKGGVTGRVADLGLNGVHAAILPSRAREFVQEFWQHAGEIISTRLADACLEGKELKGSAKQAHTLVRERVAHWLDEDPRNVFLFPSGMAGAYCIHRILLQRSGGAKTIQFGFPYVDLLKTQQEWGSGVHLLAHVRGDDEEEFSRLLNQEAVSGVFCEIPGNPLLECAHAVRLSQACREAKTPLVLDDTIATSVNVNLRPYGDMVLTSLTKLFSGTGDVIAGAVTLNSESPLYNELRQAMEEEYDDALWDEDAAVLEENSRDYEDRVKRINGIAEKVCDFLVGHNKVSRVFYPKFGETECFDIVRRPGRGYGSLFSLKVKGGQEEAGKFYDNLRVSKGPSLGTNFTLACPYMLLAHYRELEWAESCGVPGDLIRVSIGLEEADDLIGRFDEALGNV